MHGQMRFASHSVNAKLPGNHLGMREVIFSKLVTLRSFFFTWALL